MNTKLYLKQAWELLKQNRLFSTLYIVGTALAIAMTMMMAVIYYVRLAPVYPEERRATTLYMGGLKLSQTFDNGGWAWWTNGYSHRAVTEWFPDLLELRDGGRSGCRLDGGALRRPLLDGQLLRAFRGHQPGGLCRAARGNPVRRVDARQAHLAHPAYGGFARRVARL